MAPPSGCATRSRPCPPRPTPSPSWKASSDMRVLFTTSAWSAHYYMMVPLAWALRSAGHEAVVAGLPGVSEPFQRYDLTVTGDPATATVDPYPPSLQPPPGPSRRPVQYVPYNGTGQLARNALPPRNGRPRACLTLGNSTTL